MWRTSACEQYEENRKKGYVVLDITLLFDRTQAPDVKILSSVATGFGIKHREMKEPNGSVGDSRVTVAFYSNAVSYFVSIELMLRRLEKPITWFCSVAFRANKFSNKKAMVKGESEPRVGTLQPQHLSVISYRLSTVVCNDSANGFS